MARPTGDLGLLSVGAIFVVVLAVMWGGVQYSRGQLVPEDAVEERERHVRIALWDSYSEWRADRGLDPVRKSRPVDELAQGTAREFAAGEHDAGASNSSDRLTTSSGQHSEVRCARLLASYDVVHPNWEESSLGVPGTSPIAHAVADRLLAALVAADTAGVMRHTGPGWTGIGVVVEKRDLSVAVLACRPAA
ncbi:hypothetical protein BRC83_00220 [Halobacteriales archaeon QS_1_68_17]|nr:MAG: hypothetical protein BRC83_00220 [Halobacteriales archaeon QS_1_68_17]